MYKNKQKISIENVDNSIKNKKFNISCWDEFKINYWGIPKCANTSTKASFFRLDESLIKQKNRQKIVHDPRHVKFISQEEALSNGYFNFSYIRHPYERFISMYRDQGLRRPLKKIFSIEDHKNITVDNFIDKVFSKWPTDTPGTNYHIASMSSYLCDNSKVLIDNVYQDYGSVTKILEEYDLKIYKKNETDKSIPINLNDEQKERVYQRYVKDFEFFGFKK